MLKLFVCARLQMALQSPNQNNAGPRDPSGEHSQPNIRAVGSRAVRTQLHSRIVGKKIDEHMADIVTGIGVLCARVTQADNHPGIR